MNQTGFETSIRLTLKWHNGASFVSESLIEINECLVSICVIIQLEIMNNESIEEVCVDKNLPTLVVQSFNAAPSLTLRIIVLKDYAGNIRDFVENIYLLGFQSLFYFILNFKITERKSLFYRTVWKKIGKSFIFTFRRRKICTRFVVS